MEKQFCVYIMANGPRGTLYIGVTADIARRVHQHKDKLVDGFTKKYGLERLVWYELHDSAESAILREKQLKKWNRVWKIELIEKANSAWEDLFTEIVA